MSYKAITIYTPEGTAPHISAADDAFIHDALAGGRSGVLGGLTCERVDDTTVRLSGGGASNMGYIIHIPAGTSHDLTLEAGTQSLKRHDLVVSEFTKGGGEVADSHVFRIIRGTASSAPADPGLTASELLTPGEVNQVSLFRVVLNGLAIERIEPTAPILAAGEYLWCPGADATVSPESGEIKQVALTASGSIAKGRCLSVEDGAVVCAVGGTVEVIGSVYMQGTPDAEDYFACYIMKNGAELTPGIRPAILYGAVSAPLQMIKIERGDRLTLHCRTSAASGACLGGHTSTWMMVRYV